MTCVVQPECAPGEMGFVMLPEFATGVSVVVVLLHCFLASFRRRSCFRTCWLIHTWNKEWLQGSASLLNSTPINPPPFLAVRGLFVLRVH